MIRSILGWLGLGKCGGETRETVKLEVVAEQVREFNEAKRKIDDKIGHLESKTEHLGSQVSETLNMSRQNHGRLDNIEKNLERIIALSEALLDNAGESIEEEKDKDGETQQEQP